MNTKQNDFNNGALTGKGYNRVHEMMPWYDELQELLGRTLAEKLKGNVRPRILELGCGSGVTTEQILKFVPDCELVAVDNSEQMITDAKARVTAKNVSWKVQDAREFMKGEVESSYDAVVSALTIHNLTSADRDLLFNEIASVAKKNSWFINADKYALDDVKRHFQDLAEQLIAFDAFTDDPAYRMKWMLHYLEDDNVRFTEAEQRDLILRYGGCGAEFIKRCRLEAVFVAKLNCR